MYADDTHCTIASANPKDLFENTQKEIVNIAEWMRTNKLSANPQKTEFMIIGNCKQLKKIDDIPKLELNKAEIKQVQKTKSLGIIVDENLSWKEHFKQVKSKVSNGLAALKKLKNILPQSKLCQVYRALVESHMRYANVIWGSLPESKLQALQKLQNRAWSLINTAKQKDSWNHNWMDVKQLIDYDRSVMMYKILHKRCPESLTNNFEKRSTISMRETRNSNDLNIPKVRLEQTKKGFNFSGVKVWNKIPANIREKPSLSQFKNHLKKHLELEK